MLGAAFAALVAVAVVLKLLLLPARRRRLWLTSGSQLVSRIMLKVIGVRCTVSGLERQNFDRHCSLLIIPNHMSYLDVAVINALTPAVFVTSREVEATPILGWVTKAAGCAFVERRRKFDLYRDIDQLAGLLNSGYNVVLFPEGTTSPGDGLMDFKRSLLESAVRSRCRVVPVCLKYTGVDGRAYDASNRDDVAWYGTMTFFPHLWRLLNRRCVDVRLSVLNEVAFRGHKSRKLLAADARAQIAACFHAS